MRYIFVIICIVLADQGCKMAVLSHYGMGGGGVLIHDFISVSCIANDGIAFGMFADHSGIIICLTSLLIGGLMVYVFLSAGAHKVSLALAFVAGGGLSNLIDRIRLSYVIDYIDFRFWPNIFNIADVFVVLGCLMILIFLVSAVRGRG